MLTNISFLSVFQESILADIYVGAVSNPGFNWLCSPACTELEVVMMDWVGKMLGLDKSFWNESGVGGGIIMVSASLSLLLSCLFRSLNFSFLTILVRIGISIRIMLNSMCSSKRKSPKTITGN